MNMQIQTSTTEDLEEIFRLYEAASEYQKAKKTVVVWPDFDRELILTEIAEKRQWKIVAGGEVACIWAITFSDALIWEERNKDKAIYIHRIAVNPDFRGQNFVAAVTEWAKKYANENAIDYVRLDTLGNNVKLIEHYTNAGFTFLGMFNLKSTVGLPGHYHTAPACLFEIKLR